MYENLLVELPLAEFFLSKITGRNCDVDFHNLASLDPVIYRNLLYLKTYDGDVADLGLDFTVMTNDFGECKVKLTFLSLFSKIFTRVLLIDLKLMCMSVNELTAL